MYVDLGIKLITLAFTSTMLYQLRYKGILDWLVSVRLQQ